MIHNMILQDRSQRPLSLAEAYMQHFDSSDLVPRGPYHKDGLCGYKKMKKKLWGIISG